MAFRFVLRCFRPVLLRDNSFRNKCSNRSFSNHTGKGIFGLERLHRASDWQSITLETIQNCERIATTIRSSKPSTYTLQLFDDLSNELCRVLDVMELCRHIHPDPDFIGEAEKWFSVLNSYMQELNADYLLYRPLSDLEMRSSELSLDREENMMLKSLISDMQRSGIHMPSKTRQKIVELQNKIASLGFEFTRQISRPPASFSVPEDKVNELFSPTELASFEYIEQREGKRIYRSDMQTLKQILHHHEKGEARKLAYLSIYNADPSSIQVVDSLLGTRSQLARMLGYLSYSHFASVDKLMKNPERVREFLLQLNKSLQPKLENELRQLQEEKYRRELSNHPIESWEVTFYCNQIRKKQLTTENLRLDEYLQLESCLEGMFYIANCLFGIRTVEDLENPEKWHDDVRKFVFVSESGECLGTLFLDLYQRPYKYPNSTHFTIQSHRISKDGKHQLPVIAITMNMENNSRTMKESTLLHPFELQTLNHEFGHALHSILSATRFQNLAGTRTALDFVEMPSHLFEYFARDRRVLQQFAKEGFINKTIPESLVEDMLRHSQLFSGIDAQTQIFYSLLDLELHSSSSVYDGRSVDILKTVQNEHTPFRYVEGTAWHTRFGHLYGYASCYYSYLVAKVLASKIWQRLFSDNPLSKESGKLLQEKVLMVGGSKSPQEILESILDNDMKADRFLMELGINEFVLEECPSIYTGTDN
ncbi:mitochondrial intermediate peptidase [Galdieria sulphuraria]|uniref:Mitochondrial intermediate peptidase n=1 Tax=Galdieria sulphuraria TaxID=130081 RepID=M2Y9E9_GALSU|nr:mitochondrial intermediate peptidase [Galdieria sulphuraria]EME32713.1 mitochondrial intermediate peptidase [Galdieria sulphuraria]|eukprot:XP_005709233.1 mitochondrial intermediate peptidase [Galdieria sulphuraria]